jgi:hypothetical protein
VKKIPLTNGLWALCSDADYPMLRKVRWYPSKDTRGKQYAKCKEHGYMHRYIMSPEKGVIVDHIDGNGLNNQRENLRLATAAQNAANMAGRGGTSKHKGVSWVKSRERWLARLTVQGKTYQRYFETEVEAMEAYNAMAQQHHGEFAHLNVLEEGIDEFVPEDLRDGSLGTE